MEEWDIGPPPCPAVESRGESRPILYDAKGKPLTEKRPVGFTRRQS